MAKPATVSLGVIAKKTTASKSKVYPVLGSISGTVDAFLEKKREIGVLEAEAKVLSAEIVTASLPVAIDSIKSGGTELGVKATGEGGYALTVFKDDFRTGAVLEDVASAIGQSNTDKLFRQRFSLKVDGDVLVSVLGAKKVSKFVADLAALFEANGVSEALSSKEDFVPESVTALFKALSLEKVLALREVYNIPASTTAK